MSDRKRTRRVIKNKKYFHRSKEPNLKRIFILRSRMEKDSKMMAFRRKLRYAIK